MTVIRGDDFDGNEGNVKTMAFKPVGPVASRFLNDRMFISSIMGPYGSAKTTSCFQKILNCLLWQRPGPDGIRRIRVCVIRDTYGQLEKNVMNDWFGWFPKAPNNWNGGDYKHTVTLDFPGLGAGGGVGRGVMEVYFVGLGELKAEDVFKGMQLTLLWLNEVDTLDPKVLEFGLPRVGRYPAMKDGGCAWSGVIADFNAPDVDNWVYDLFVDKNLGVPDELLAQLQAEFGPLFGISFHKQPGGRTPEAENLHNLIPGYYDRLLLGFKGNENKIRRFIDNEFGAVSNGQPVYPEFSDLFHVAREPLKAIPGVPISIGIDGGNTPAIVFGQEDEDGQIRIIDELVVFNADEDKALARLGPTNFAREARAFMDARYPHARFGEGWGDPASLYGEDEEDLAWLTKFGNEFRRRVKASPVKGNRLTIRLEAVRGCLTNNVGARPGLIISPTCKHLRRGFNNGYIIQRVKYSTGGGRTKDEPLKNDFSHVHDALQYLVCGFKKRGNPTLDLDGREAMRRARANVHFGDGYFSGRGQAVPAAARRRGRV